MIRSHDRRKRKTVAYKDSDLVWIGRRKFNGPKYDSCVTNVYSSDNRIEQRRVDLTPEKG